MAQRISTNSATAVVAISKRGMELARTLVAALEESHLFFERRLEPHVVAATPFDLPLRPLIQDLFTKYRRLILFLPVGAAVRLLAPSLRSKLTDPAVVCVDESGRFAVSLLSGHRGGADALAQEVAAILRATPVITSAAFVMDLPAVDILGRDCGWRLEAEPRAITRASAAMIDGEPIGFYQEAGERDWYSVDGLPGNISRYSSLEALASSTCTAALIVTDRLVDTALFREKAVVVYRPRTLAVGLGCRKDVAAEELEDFLFRTLERHGLAKASVKCLATAEMKRHEIAVEALGERLEVPIYYYSPAALNDHPGPSPASASYERFGLRGVCEPSALLASGCGELLVPKEKSPRVTVAVARQLFPLP